MDASGDRDIELQRASGDLIDELKAKLPPLLWKSTGEHRQIHRWAQCAQTEKLRTLLEPFQEWPQLLDPHLQEILSQLTEAFLAYLKSCQDQYASMAAIHVPKNGVVEPLPRAVCKFIYVLCKVRGVKVITRFLNNEPKYLEHMLRAFIDWDSVTADNEVASSSTGQGHPMTWEERYVMLTWLSHLFLAPFDLSSISSDNIPIPYDNLSALSGISEFIPPVALSALSITLKYAVLPGKEREAAVALLARLALRSDMQRLGLLDVLIRWAFKVLNLGLTGSSTPAYTSIGILSFIARLGVLGRVDDLARFMVSIFNGTVALARGGTQISVAIRASASARKLVIKVYRSMTILALALEERLKNRDFSDRTCMILEESIDHFLRSLADKDTPVRFAASKALSMLALRLGPEMGSDIVEAVLESLEENIFYEKQDGTLIPGFDAEITSLDLVKRNTSAVDPNRWQGLILTLGHLLFRRALPPDNLGQVLQSLISGLDFEQRSATGTSVGVGVRDASCFGIWSVARKYSTSELCALDPREVRIGARKDENVLQILATELVCAGCLDPSGNIRRGASAALQELIGRHPDTIVEGISVVQIVDYHAVARRTNAMHEVTKGSAALGNLYWKPLLDGLLQWRGIRSPDSRSRRAAASAIGELSVQEGYKSVLVVLRQTLGCLSSLPSHAIGSRHGCFLSLAAIVDAFLLYQSANPSTENDALQVAAEVSKLWEVLDGQARPTEEGLTLSELRPDLTAEASARFMSSLARSCAPIDENRNPIVPSPPEHLLQKAVDILVLCVSRADDLPVEASSTAASDIFVILPPSKQMEIVKRWLNNIDASWKSATGRGQIAALGAVFKQLPSAGEGRTLIVNELLKSTGGEELILKRSSAVKCITTGILPYTDDVGSLSLRLCVYLNDYTTDNRGDIGSFLRLEALHGVNYILISKMQGERPPYVYELMKCVVRLAAEKLDKVRFEAWKCFEIFWKSETKLPPLQREYEHLSEVSSPDYLLQLLSLLSVGWIRPSLIKGLVTSINAGTEGLIQSSRLALVQHIKDLIENEGVDLRLKIFKDLMLVLESTMDDDRYAIPTVDTMSFFLDNCISRVSAKLDFNFRDLFLLVQRFHFKSTNIPRIEAAVKVYAALLRQESIRQNVMKKMMGMLLHSYPKVRSTAAECLFMETRDRFLKEGDWSLPPSQLKGVVDSLRQNYGLG